MPIFPRRDRPALEVLYASARPDPQVLALLSAEKDVRLQEAFSTRGALAGLAGCHLVVLGDLVLHPQVTPEAWTGALQRLACPVARESDFPGQASEWLARARLAGGQPVSLLPARQVNLVNWCGGVGKTTLALAACRRFAARTGLPAALLELSLGGSALHARIRSDLPEFYAIATGKQAPAAWHGVCLYPMDGRSFAALWAEDPGRVLEKLAAIRRAHTLLVVDAFPGHPLFPVLGEASPGRLNLVVASPRDDTRHQARRLMDELQGECRLVLNMARSLADRVEPGASAVLPYREDWAAEYAPQLADPLLALAYPGWRGGKA